jgi:hypothetical protein
LIKEIQIRIAAKDYTSDSSLIPEISRKLKVGAAQIKDIRVRKKSIDARQKTIFFQLLVVVGIGEYLPSIEHFKPFEVNLSDKKAIVVGAGPAGLFASIELLQLGIKPILLERGKPVRERRRDLAKINKEHVVNPESNYCFGEGGAGTYSDGKLYTRSNKRGDVRNILDWLVYFGAEENILIEAHPHIGTNKLPKIIENIRAYIIQNGGEVHFESKVTDILIRNHRIEGVRINDEREILAENIILATGHSSRDIFKLLQSKEIEIEAKPFALGVRVEHQQTLIDHQQYNCSTRPDYLPPAAYSLVTQTKEKPVFSFCMCPGGIIAPCATAPGEIVTNGWSPSKRNNPYANSGIVVSIDESDWKHLIPEHGALSALVYQSDIEQKAFELGGKTQTAPAQTSLDFVLKRKSHSLPKTSYQPGIKSIETDDLFPQNITEALRLAFKDFNKKIPGFISEQGIIHMTESRTSSPVKIPRDAQNLEHTQIKGLYPCGEGAGYAGGIMSAAIDGQNCARKIASKLI